MEQHENAINLINSLDMDTSNLNEATTRSRIIDTVLYDILSYPKNAVIAEESNKKGYTDYTIKNILEEKVLIIEAKKEGIYFDTPNHTNSHKSFIKVKTLLTNTSIKSALEQVRGYCLETGTSYGAITNGHVWIFFIAFSQNWEEKHALVINNLKYFSEDFTEAYNLLNYNQVINHKSLQNILHKNQNTSRITYFIKSKINSFAAPVDLNVYAQYISGAIQYYFSDFDNDDIDFLSHCYVDEGKYENTKNTLSSMIVDNVTPYLENHGVIGTTRDKLSKKLTKKITNFLEYSDNKHIVVIYGDRGCGKSTFIRKLINADIPLNVREKLYTIYIDLLKFAPSENFQSELKNYIWQHVLDQIDVDNLRNDYQAIQNILFPEEFEVYKKQIASLYKEGSEIYGMKLEDKIKEMLSDYLKLSQKLINYLREMKNQEVVLVVDNTDQFSQEIQDFSFQVVAEIFDSINTLSFITIREERFFRSKNLGVLDAYATMQYHISSPQADKVFKQRLQYIIDSLENEKFFDKLIQSREIIPKNKELVTKENIKKYLLVFKKDFDKKSNLYTFLISCAQKDMRKALDLFRELVVSGYLNVYEMISSRNIFTLQIHQVLKPLMTPKKYFYEEDSSAVPNIFKLRYLENGSHFTSIRILKYLNRNSTNYHKLSILKTDFISIFNMEEDFNNNIEELMKYKLIEADIKLDTYEKEVEEIIITPFGKYFIEKLIHFFTYLDLICTDCSLYDEQTANFIANSANNEYKLFSTGKRGQRMIYRVEKTNSFIQYLYQQEKNEKELFNFHTDYDVMEEVNKKYLEDLESVKISALKQNYSSLEESEELEKYFND